MVFVLDRINGPADLRSLTREELEVLAAEIREFLVSTVARTGGHLGPNLGVVELTIALHRVFDSPAEPIIFDTGHQSYVHKILTGRRGGFSALRQAGGLSGYPSRAESPHDFVENSHASTSLSWSEGLARARRLQGNDDAVVAVVGDGALTGGMVWEALNNIAVEDDLRLVIVVNDNGRSYTPTVGGLATRLTSLRTDPRYEQTLRRIKQDLPRAPVFGKPAYDLLHAIKRGFKDMAVPTGLFADLGIKYVGPVDGHDIEALEHALEAAKGFGGPVIVHCLTRKGKGFKAAEENIEDHLHAIGQINETTGEPLPGTGNPTWTDTFADELVKIGSEREDVVAVTAAMMHPTGLARFKASYPARAFDVGIAEQHAVTSAAGLALGGLHPVVAVYSTFLNRAFDQVLMDVALHELGVTFVLDRAGVTGADGPSHNGMWDVSLLGIVPGLRLAIPRDPARLRQALRQAVDVSDAPTVIRFPKAEVGVDLPAESQAGEVDVLLTTPHPAVLLLGFGPMAEVALDVGGRLRQQGIGVTVGDPVWALPVSSDVVDLARRHELVVTIEDNGVAGGIGSRIAQAVAAAGVLTPVRQFGLPQKFLAHGKRGDILAEERLTAQPIALATIEMLLAVRAAAGDPQRTDQAAQPAE